MTDNELIHILQTNPEHGIHIILSLYGGSISTICRNFLYDCSEADVEEAVADTLIHFWNYRNDFVLKSEYSLKSYLYAIARNVARDLRRKHKKADIFSMEELSLDLPADTCNDVTLTAVSSIGNRNRGYIRINTDYEIPDTFDLETNFLSLSEISVKSFSSEEIFQTSEKAFIEDNKLCFFISISDSKNLKKSTISISIGDILIYHNLDDFVARTNEEVLVEGTWNLNCKYQYADTIQTHRMLKKVQFQDITYYITKIELSKLSIRISAFVMSKDIEKNNLYRWVDQIELEDGTILSLDTYTPCSQKNQRIDYYIYFDEIGELIDVDNVKALMIFGERIEL